MTKRAWIILVSATTLLGLLLLLVLFQPNEPVKETNLFENKLQVRFELREGEVTRKVEYYPDLLTPRHAVADLKNGHQKVFSYRTDGTLERASTFGAETNGNRSVLRMAILDSDGITYLEDKEFYESGNLKRLLLLEDPDTTTERRYHDKNGWNLALSRVLSRNNEDRSWTIVSELAYRDNGTKSKSFEIVDNVETTLSFDEHEQVMSRHVHDRNKDLYTEKDFAEDGETILRLVNQDDDGTRLELKRPDGTTIEKREWWGQIGQSGMHVYKFDEEGRKTISQWWLFEGDTINLRQVQVFNPEEGFETRSIILFTTGPGKGKIEHEMIYESPKRNGGPHTYRQYHPDGSLMLERTYSGGDNLVSERTLSEEDAVFINHDPHWMEIREIEYPPYKVEYIPDNE